MGQELAGKVAVVTGGAGGLGRAMVGLFVTEGASVVIADVDTDGGTALADQLGPGVAFKQTDVADANQMQDVVDLAVDRFGGLDIMCNNAGIGSSFKRFLDDDLSDFDRVVAVNLFGVIVGSQRAARHMSEHGGGVIVNITSIGGINAGPGLITYRATKAAVIHLTRSIAIELARYGIRVNCVAPAHIPTAINAALDQEALVRAMQPLRRLGSPRDVAEAVLYLASDRAAQVTGIVLPVDGGSTAGAPPRSVKDLMASRDTAN
jgi:NAD(P)-dependent dehydrogenase (short-subunit alcohol dehydrogenase family)